MSKLAEQEMDGDTIVQCFAAGSGAHCLKDVVGKFGTRIKVYSAIKSFLSKVIYTIISLGIIKHVTFVCRIT